jgi:restriction system protein
MAGGAISISVMKVRATRRHQEETMQLMAAEIESNARALRIGRIQLVQTDRYRTVNVDKWEAEKRRYIETRIIPIVRLRGLDTWFRQVAATIDYLVEDAAQRPVTPTDSESSRFVSNPEVFDARMDPLDYEKHCALQLQKAGWSTRLTAATGDQGADVIASRDGKILVLQCKLYSQPVGNDAVQQAYSARGFQVADIAAVVSNQPYTKAARELANVNGVHLLHHEELCRFIR